MSLAQDCDQDGQVGGHRGPSRYSWDFGDGEEFEVAAAREGTIVHVKMSSERGCPSPQCANFANYVMVDHGDGTMANYWHVKAASLRHGLRCGSFVRRGQPLATAYKSGLATGIHLHFNVVRADAMDAMAPCECGPDGTACSPGFRPSRGNAVAIPIDFAEWDASLCSSRNMLLTSLNAEAKGPVLLVRPDDPKRFAIFGRSGALGVFGSLGGWMWWSARGSGSDTPSVRARYLLDDLVDEPGLYNLWIESPPEISSSREARVELRTAAGIARFNLVQRWQATGAYQRLTSRPIKLTGARGEQVEITNAVSTSSDVAFGAVQLTWAGPLGDRALGAHCKDAGECAGALICDSGARCADSTAFVE